MKPCDIIIQKSLVMVMLRSTITFSPNFRMVLAINTVLSANMHCYNTKGIMWKKSFVSCQCNYFAVCCYFYPSLRYNKYIQSTYELLKTIFHTLSLSKAGVHIKMNSQNHNIIVSCIPYYLSDYLLSRADIIRVIYFHSC